MATPIIKKGRRCITQRTTAEKIIQLRKELGLNQKQEAKRETLRANIRAVNIGRADWCRI
jgi:hypothetical protein